MKLHYHPDTDSLYIHLSEKTSVDSEELSDGVVLDFDEQGALVGIDIDHASALVDLTRLETESLPMQDGQGQAGSVPPESAPKAKHAPAKKKRAQAPESDGRISETTVEEGREIFDRAARYHLGISGDEFIRRYDAGEYDDDPDQPGIMDVIMMLPFAGRW